MDKIDWMDIGKIAAAIVPVAGAFAAFLWRQWRSFKRKTNQLTAEIKDLRRQRDQFKAGQQTLKNRHKNTKELWRTRITAEFDRIRSLHRLRIAERVAQQKLTDIDLASAKDKIADRDLCIVARDAQIAELQQSLTQRKADLHSIQTTLSQQRDDLTRHEANEAALTQELLVARTSIDDLARAHDDALSRCEILAADKQELEARIESIFKLDGRLWNVPVSDGVSVPGFRPLRQRNMPIISVLNFKGGVGKTSITVNLAGLQGQIGKRTLMVDLDYQRSLSQLVMSDAARRTRQLELRCLQHFLAGDNHGTQFFLDFAHRVESPMESCWIVPNSASSEIRHREESLEETENQLMAEWMIHREQRPDIRFFLREALHGIGIESQFDSVILDCPPRLTTSTINALAASDFVLVPVVLDRLSANSLSPLITALREFRGLFTHLKFLGVVGNQATIRMGKPKKDESELWKALEHECKALYSDYPVKFFDTIIPLHPAFGKACSDKGPELAIKAPAIFKVFDELNDEIQKEISSHAHSHSSAILV